MVDSCASLVTPLPCRAPWIDIQPAWTPSCTAAWAVVRGMHSLLAQSCTQTSAGKARLRCHALRLRAGTATGLLQEPDCLNKGWALAEVCSTLGSEDQSHEAKWFGNMCVHPTYLLWWGPGAGAWQVCPPQRSCPDPPAAPWLGSQPVLALQHKPRSCQSPMLALTQSGQHKPVQGSAGRVASTCSMPAAARCQSWPGVIMKWSPS